MKIENGVPIPHNLPPGLRVFVDREYERIWIERALVDPGLSIITVSGPAGIGKTAFATQVAGEQLENRRFPGGVIFLDCDILTSLPNILARIADALGIESISLTPSALRDRVFYHLRSAPTLLIFDGYETVAEDDEVLSFVGRLPRPTKALILTRKSVRIPGREVSLRLSSFDENVALALWRQYLGPEQWTRTDEEALREINRLTGGLPLAVGLVGSLLEQGWSLPDILRRLQEGAIPTEKVVERVLDQIDTTLKEEQRRFLEGLSVFAHPVDRTAITAVVEIEDWRQSSEALSRMSFIEVVDGRYTLHPLVRTYFRNRIAPGQLEVLQRRMAQYYLSYVESLQYEFDQIDREWLNIQHAIETTHRNQLWQLFKELVLRLGQFTSARGYENDYQRWLSLALEVSEKTGDVRARAAFLHNLGIQHQRRGDLDTAVELYEQSLRLKEAAGDAAAESATLTNLGSVYRSRGDIRSAIAYYERALAISRRIGDRLGEANIIGSLGVSYADLGDYRLAVAYYEQALAISREIGDHRGEANALGNLGASYADLSEYRLAVTCYEQALAISREMGDRRGEASYLRNLGIAYRNLYARTGSAENLDIAIPFFQQALDISREISDRQTEANLYANLGTAYRGLYARTGSAENLDIAIPFFQQALDISREIGDRQTEANLYANLGTAYQDLYARTGSADNLYITIHFFQQALEFFRVETYPAEYATIQNNLGNAYAALQTGSKEENIERAIAHYREALRVHPPDSPFVSSSLHNLGVALRVCEFNACPPSKAVVGSSASWLAFVLLTRYSRDQISICRHHRNTARILRRGVHCECCLSADR